MKSIREIIQIVENSARDHDLALLTELGENGHPSGQLRLARDAMLPSDTLLVHFTFDPDAARSISEHGFTRGARWEHLANSMMWDSAGGRPGFNFAFLAGSKDARAFSTTVKGAVLFRHKGVLVDHLGDHEQQVIFWGPFCRGPFVVMENSEKGWLAGDAVVPYAKALKLAQRGL